MQMGLGGVLLEVLIEQSPQSVMEATDEPHDEQPVADPDADNLNIQVTIKRKVCGDSCAPCFDIERQSLTAWALTNR